LIVVILDENRAARFFVMHKAEALEARGNNMQLGTTQQRDSKFQVKDVLLPHENQWVKITTA
jgi:hypothetical protein